ncbi:Bidirectional sugar transporter SWEET1a [Ananas comosus]|uniref:Bidirectional sugar transporter SWEET n=1 Tax=Ananas comosus TaxID=4615 RepID=A0A199W1C0_ANACO|nr:Bidirectional sugar transporter SWEET1a [Ananas comosus]
MLIVLFLSLYAGNVTALFLFLSPILTFRRIQKNKSTEDFSGVPYGMPFVSPNNLLVSTINGAGTAIELVYVIIFLTYASTSKVRMKMLGLLMIVSSIFAAVVLISLLALHGQSRKLFCGSAATIFSICMYASPLSIMSVEFMPFFLSLFVFLCGTSWFIYGLLGRDPFVTVPNGCGSFLGALQLILYMIYRDRKGRDTTKDDSIEMEESKSAKTTNTKPMEKINMQVHHQIDHQV